MGRVTESTSKRARRVLVAGACLAAAAGCSDGAVRFGPPDNLRIRDTKSANLACPPPKGSTGAPCPDWETVIFPLFDGKIGGKTYACTETACHGDATKGGNPSKGLTLYPGNPKASYDALAAYKNLAGRPYVADGANLKPGDLPPYVICNLTADPLVGSRMPQGAPVSDADMITIGNWALCGMKEKGGTAGAGGGGGAGGTGGAGGAKM